MDSEFTELLIDAFMGRRPERRIIGPHPNLRRDIIAVARVALERAAEVARVRAMDLYAEADEMARNVARDRMDEIGFDRMARDIRTRGNIAMVLSEDIRALMADDVEGLLPVEDVT